MLKYWKTGAALAFASLLSLAGPAFASDETELIHHSVQTVENMRHDAAFGPARNMLDGARGILIVPNLVKGGFIFGAEGGNGVLMARTPRGNWSEPAFMTIGSGSFGLQAGLEDTSIVMLIMSDRALHAIENGNFKLGAGAGLTVVTLGAGAEGATASNLSGDLVIWTSAKGGLYGGLTLNGSVISPRDDWNRDFYHHDVRPGEILANDVHNPDALGLRDQLASVK